MCACLCKDIGDGVGENLGQILTIWCHRGQDTVDGKGQDGTIIEKRMIRNISRELQLVAERGDVKADGT